MIDKIKHYSITNNPSVYDEESMTALELAGRTASKVNELIEDTDDRLNEQNTEIDKFKTDVGNDIDKFKTDVGNDIDTRFNTIKTNYIPQYVGEELTDEIENGTFNEVIANATEDTVEKQMIPYGRFIASDGLNYEIYFNELVEGEQYSNSNGTITTGDGCYRSKYIYPCREHVYLTFTPFSSTGYGPYNYIACYDQNMNFIGFSRITSDVTEGAKPVNVTLTGTCFVGFTFMGDLSFNTFSNTPVIKINHIDNGLIDAIYHPFDKTNKNYMYFKNHWCDNVSAIATTDNFDCVVFNVAGLKQVVSTENNLKNAIFIDGANNVISNGETFEQLNSYGNNELVYPRGRVYDVPDNAVVCVMNLSNIPTRQGEKITNGVVSLIHKNGKRLNGKRITCIGDSITFLDGKQGYDNTSPFEGWQDELRKRGAIITTYAYSGLPLNGSDNIANHFMTEFKNEKMDVAIIFGGSNDVRLYTPISEIPNNYSASYYDSDSIQMGIDNIAWCIKNYEITNNTSVLLFICSLIPSSSTTHFYENDKPYLDAIENFARTHHRYIDLFNIMPKPLNSNFEYYYYDETHPNYKGMAQIGRVIAREIERVIE